MEKTKVRVTYKLYISGNDFFPVTYYISGMDEHEQKGVTIPSRAAALLAPIPWNFPSIFLLRSGGK